MAADSTRTAATGRTAATNRTASGLIVSDSPPATPAGFSATAGSVNITASWTPNTEPDLSGYELERATAVDGPYSLIASPVGSSVIDVAPTPGTTFYYRARSRDTAGQYSAYTTPASAVITEPVDETPPDAPTGFTATVNGRDVDLTWTDDTPTDFVATYVYRNETGTFDDNSQPISGAMTDEAYTDTPPDLDVEFSYAARSIDEAGNWSAFSTVDTATIASTELLAPSGIGSENQEGGVRVFWDDSLAPVDGANLYRATDGPNGTYALVNTGDLITDNQYVDEDAATDGSNWYTVRFSLDDVESDDSAITAGHPLTPTPVEESVAGTESVYWTEVVQTLSSPTATDIRVGKASGNSRNAAIRFPSVPFDADVTPDSVKLRLTGRGDTTGTPVNLVASFVDSVNVPLPTTYDAAENPAAGRTSTVAVNDVVAGVASVADDLAGLDGDLDLSVPFMERVQADDWFSGAPLLLYLEDNGSVSGKSRSYQSPVTAYDPQLVVAGTALGDAIAPSAPIGVVGTAEAGGNRVTWTRNVENDMSGYHIDRTPTAGGTTVRLTGTTSTSNVTYLDQTPLDGVSYDYTVVGVDTSANEGADSSAVTVVTDLGDVPPVDPPPVGEAGNHETALPLMMYATDASIAICYEVPTSSTSARIGPKYQADKRSVLNDTWHLKTSGAASGATTIPCSPLPIPLADNSQIVWHSPKSGATAAKIVVSRLSAAAAAGATALTVDALPASIPATVFATSADVTAGTTRTVGDVIGGATAWITGLQYRPTADSSTWYMGVQPVYWNDGQMTAFSGLLIDLDPDTSYTVRITIADPIGTIETNPREATISTRPNDDTPTPAAMLAIAASPPGGVAGKFVNAATGNDTTGDGTSGNPWKTLAKLFDVAEATAGPWVWVASVAGDEQILDNYNLNLGSTKELHVIAANPVVTGTVAVGDSADLTETTRGEASRTRITSGHSSGPVGSGAATEGNSLWTAVTGTGSISGDPYGDWWTYTPAVNPAWLGWSETIDSEIHQLWQIKPHAQLNDTDDHRIDWVNHIGVNKHGYYNISGRILLSLPPLSGHTDPNEIVIWYGPDTLLHVTATKAAPVYGASFRLSGFELSNAKHAIQTYTSHHTYIDHNLFDSELYGIWDNGTKSPNWAYGRNQRIKNNIFRGWGFRAPEGSGTPAAQMYLSWQGVKASSRWVAPNGTTYNLNRVFADGAEGGTAKGSGSGIGRIVEGNDISQWFNGYGDSVNSGFAYGTPGRWKCFGSVYRGNKFHSLSDDADEIENIGMSVWFDRNEIEYTSVASSMADSYYGPHLMTRNHIWRLGHEEVGLPHGAVGAMLSKMGLALKPQFQFWFNNTIWTDQPESKGWHIGSGGEDLAVPPVIVVRNCVLRFKHQICRSGVYYTNWDEDYCIYAADPAGVSPAGANDPGLRWKPKVPGNETLYTQIAPYRFDTGQGLHSNRVGVGGADIDLLNIARLDALFTDPTGGDLTPDPNVDGAGVNPLKDAGCWIPNITQTWTGDAPSIGKDEI